jgi:hypothetical protein
MGQQAENEEERGRVKNLFFFFQISFNVPYHQSNHDSMSLGLEKKKYIKF